MARSYTAKIVALIVALAVVITALVMGKAFWSAGRTIFDLLNENKELKAAIANLTAESQIGYAKVIEQGERDGRLFTRLLFVETQRDDPTRRVFEREYEIEGDVAHFDALIVTFPKEYVMDGKGRALYLWRRIYGERLAPEAGFAIGEKGSEPARYAEISRVLSVRDRRLFWEEIWKLADDPARLSKAGIEAVYGNVVYRSLRPGLIYIFKISSTGQITIEFVPAL